MEIIAQVKLLYKGDMQISGNVQEVTLQTIHAWETKMCQQQENQCNSDSPPPPPPLLFAQYYLELAGLLVELAKPLESERCRLQGQRDGENGSSLLKMSQISLCIVKMFLSKSHIWSAKSLP